MLPGPVFHVELVTSARKWGHYVARFAYGLLLLAIIAQNFSAWEAFTGGHYAIRQMASFGRTIFLSFALSQFFAVAFLTPALVAGTIASEKQRKTLHDLLASRLSSAEIVLGKLLARLLHVGVFLAIGLPVVALLGLLGGVEPELVALAYVVTISTGLFLAALAILVSTLARGVREAVAMSYSLAAAWLIIPALVDWLLPLRYPVLASYVRPVNEWIAASSPWFHLGISTIMSGPAIWLDRVIWMVQLQLGYAALFVALAVWRLRPTFMRQDGAGAYKFVWKHWRWRLFARTEVGRDAMLWKEMQTSRSTGAAKIATVLIGLVMLAGLAYETCEFAVPAFRELWGSRYGEQGRFRDELNLFVRLIVAGLGLLVTLGVTTASATGLTTEREEDTWTSLTTTPLNGWEILRAKLVGPVWALRGVFATMVALVLVGVAAGAVHPVGAMAWAVERLVFTGFATALGTYLSLRAKSTWRAQSLAIFLLLLANGGYLMCFCPIYFTGWPLIGFGITPMIEGMTLVSYREYQIYVTDPTMWFAWNTLRSSPVGAYAGACILGVILYALAALVLVLAALARFDTAAGRPRRYVSQAFDLSQA